MTQLIPVSSVIIPDNRQRKAFKQTALDELKESIIELGLLQPIVLRNDKKTLIAGERRFRAISELAKTNSVYRHNGQAVKDASIPYVTVDDLTHEQLIAAELAENAIRVDLTWQERAKAVADLHNFRIIERGAYDKSTKLGQTIKDTATEILGDGAKGRALTELSDSLLLSEFLDDPLVVCAKDIKTAKKAIRNELANRERMARVQAYDEDATHHTLFLGNSFTTPLPMKDYSCIVLDPPYGKDADKVATYDTDMHEYDDSYERLEEILEIIPDLTYEAAADQAHLYCFCDIRFYMKMKVAFELSGWDVWRRPLIWNKGAIGSFADIDYGPRACYETILYANKNRKKLNAGYRDVIEITQDTRSLHPANKPIALIAELLKRSTLPGDHVLDLFAGSGPIFDAAQETKTIATGIEMNPKYHAMCVERLDNIQGQRGGLLDGEIPFMGSVL